jgi:hypothetical protein
VAMAGENADADDPPICRRGPRIAESEAVVQRQPGCNTPARTRPHCIPSVRCGSTAPTAKVLGGRVCRR